MACICRRELLIEDLTMDAVGRRYGVIDDCIDANMPWKMFDLMMLPSKAAAGMVSNAPEDAIAIDFHNIDNSLDSSDRCPFCIC